MRNDSQMKNSPGAELGLPKLERYFAQNVSGFVGPLRAELVNGGRSNLTYTVSDPKNRWILRRPPLGQIAPTANDIGREHTAMSALEPTPVPVARAVALCEDPSIIGTPFSVASMIDGYVVRSASDGAALKPQTANHIAANLISELVVLHSIDFREVGLTNFGRPEHYLQRQISRWSRQWSFVTTRTLSSFTELHSRLSRSIPEQSDVSIIHGDYRIDNTILSSEDLTSIAAIVDWEMSTLGDPLADLGLLLVYWDEISAPVLPDGSPISINAGFPSPDQIIELYGRASGRDLGNLSFYRALGFFKLAVIAEGIAERHAAGLTIGSGFETVGTAVEPLLQAGLDLLLPRETQR